MKNLVIRFGDLLHDEEGQRNREKKSDLGRCSKEHQKDQRNKSGRLCWNAPNCGGTSCALKNWRRGVLFVHHLMFSAGDFDPQRIFLA